MPELTTLTSTSFSSNSSRVIAVLCHAVCHAVLWPQCCDAP